MPNSPRVNNIDLIVHLFNSSRPRLTKVSSQSVTPTTACNSAKLGVIKSA